MMGTGDILAIKHARKAVAVTAVGFSVAAVLVEREAISRLLLGEKPDACQPTTRSFLLRECKESGAEAFVLVLRQDGDAFDKDVICDRQQRYESNDSGIESLRNDMKIFTPDLLKKVIIVTFGYVANRRRVGQERSVGTSADSGKIIGCGNTNFHMRAPCIGSSVIACGIATTEILPLVTISLLHETCDRAEPIKKCESVRERCFQIRCTAYE
jgi:hypothetical protein